MAANAPNQQVTDSRRGRPGKTGVRLARFAGAALAALTATEITLTLANGVFDLTATPAALVSWFAGVNKLGYRSAGWLGLTGGRHVLWVDFVWLVANLGTFLLRFTILHYVVFADRPAGIGHAPGHTTAPGAKAA